MIRFTEPTKIGFLKPDRVNGHYRDNPIFSLNVKVSSHDPILVQLSFQIFLCMIENVVVHTIRLSHPIIS